MAKVLVAGGTGTVGRDVVGGLLARGHEPRVLARDPEKARGVLGTSVAIVKGDLTDPASLTKAMKGVEVGYVATTPGVGLAEQENNFIEAARAAKLRRVVKLSGYGVREAPDRIHQEHAISEQRTRGSGLDYVILQPVMFMTNLSWEAASIKEGTIASTFGDGRMSFVDPRDVAELAVVALTASDLRNAEWEFGGPEPLSYDDVAATFSRVLDRPIQHVRLDLDVFRREAKLPEIVIEAITASGELARRGKYEVSDDVVRKQLGRRARSLESWIKENRALFAKG